MCIMTRKATPQYHIIYEVRYECPDDTYPFVMEYCVNRNMDDTTRRDLNEINEIGVDEEGGEF